METIEEAREWIWTQEETKRVEQKERNRILVLIEEMLNDVGEQWDTSDAVCNFVEVLKEKINAKEVDNQS